MSDRELLELAAKAAGYVIELDMNWGTGGMPFFRMSGNKWNPLADDGDALRLAVKLRIDFYTSDMNGLGETTEETAVTWHLRSLSNPVKFWESKSEPFGSDPCAATRRAIVRAAAEVGKQMMEPTT